MRNPENWLTPGPANAGMAPRNQPDNISCFQRDRVFGPYGRDIGPCRIDKDFRVEPHAYGVFRAAAIPSTSLGSAGVCLGNTRALVACSKS